MIDTKYALEKLAHNELTDSEIREISNEVKDIVREKMTDKQFWVWVSTWYDAENILECIEGWDTQLELESLDELRAIINK